MSRYNHQREVSHREYTYRILTVLAATALLVVFMPRRGYTLQDFKEGQAWYSSAVYAPDSFPILKSEVRVQSELDSAMREFKPYYGLNQLVPGEQVKAFKRYFAQRFAATIPAYYQDRITKQLYNLYDRGIMDTEEYDRLKQEKRAGIILIDKYQQGYAVPLSQVLTPKSAYELLVNDPDSLRYNHAKLRSCDLDRFLRANLVYDQEKSDMHRQEIESSVTRYSDYAQKGQKIVDFGDIVKGDTYDMLCSLREYEHTHGLSSADRMMQIGGQILFALLVVLALLMFFSQFRSDYLESRNTVAMVLLLVLLFPIVTYLLIKHGIGSEYMVPFCILPILLRVFLDSRTAFISHMCSVLLAALPLANPYEFVFLQIMAGLTAIYSMRQLTQRNDLFVAALWVTAVSMCCCLAFDLLHQQFDRTQYGFIAVGCSLVLISYLLLVPFERLFGFTSIVTLAELSNTNNEVLRRLSEEAPGTFQHSMQVANLAGEVANKLGAKSQLVRTAAFYHDIGKLEGPVFFTENQSGKNPHDNMSRIHSANLIRCHVENGLKLAEQYHLPAIIRDCIATHHGKGLIKYFYVSYKNENPDKEVDERLFRYKGPNPSTQEQAILMMADAVEAASHSLPEYTEESVRTLVNRIVDGQVTEGFFTNCPITLRDITVAKRVLSDKLLAIYHTRVAYPEAAKEKKEGE